MQIPLQITMRDMPHSDAIETDIRNKAEKLHLYNNRIMSCRIVVDSVQKHKHQGKEYLLRIDVRLPGTELVVNKHRNEDAYVAIRDAFNALQRQLKSHNKQIHGIVKTHGMDIQGKVARVFEDYGFIECMDGIEYYFHRDNVINNNFENITPGTEVLFWEAESPGETLQANHIIVKSINQANE